MGYCKAEENLVGTPSCPPTVYTHSKNKHYKGTIVVQPGIWIHDTSPHIILLLVNMVDHYKFSRLESMDQENIEYLP